MPKVTCNECGRESFANEEKPDHVCRDCDDKPRHGKGYIARQLRSYDADWYRARVINNDR